MIAVLRSALRVRYLGLSVIILCAVILMLCLVWGRAWYGSMLAYDRGERFFREHEYIKAITFYDRAIHWYTPFNPYVERSANRLWQISEIADQKGDIRLSIIAAETLRNAFLSTSGLNEPGRYWINRCDERINAFPLGPGGKVDEHNSKGSGKSIAEKNMPAPPIVFWTVILEIGLLAWVAAVIRIIFLLKDYHRERLSFSIALKWGGLALAFFSMWIVGMIRA